jgi:hypothetical protein
VVGEAKGEEKSASPHIFKYGGRSILDVPQQVTRLANNWLAGDERVRQFSEHG